ncbi:MAG: Co2+/Mg2+ efflux protein ApaG [Halioglobus sp.]
MDKFDQMEAQANQVSVKVLTTYLPSHSNPEDDHYTFAYTITISNNSDVPVQLLSRHWIITDADNQVQEVRGEGVVGEQPVIAPGKFFRYTSGTTMETAVGFMEGSYTMISIASEGEDQDAMGTFDVPIQPFSLHIPNALH